MELVFRIRESRLDKHGRTSVWADIHWAGHRIQPGVSVKVEPGNWQPEKTNRIHNREAESKAKNLRLQKVVTAVSKLFTSAEGSDRPEASITPEEVHATVATALGAQGVQKLAKQEAAAEPTPTLTAASTWQEFNQQWKEENAHHMAVQSMRQYAPTVARLTIFDPTLRLATLTKANFARYIAYLHAEKLKDNTVQTHYKFLRECHCMVGMPVPKWLQLPASRRGRAPSLKKELLQVINVEGLPEKLRVHRDMFVLQTLLVLRDSDLRAIKPHHIRQIDLPGYGATWCLEIHQQKTGDPILIPLPAEAATIWERYQGRLPIVDRSFRGYQIKKVVELAGVTREFVQIRFSGKNRYETVAPLWKFVNTHTARHTGADMLLIGSQGNQNLKELALGHASASAYGYDTVERYGPEMLDAWNAVLGTSRPLAQTKTANGFEVIPRFFSFRKASL